MCCTLHTAAFNTLRFLSANCFVAEETTTTHASRSDVVITFELFVSTIQCDISLIAVSLSFQGEVAWSISTSKVSLPFSSSEIGCVVAVKPNSCILDLASSNEIISEPSTVSSALDTDELDLFATVREEEVAAVATVALFVMEFVADES